MHIAFPQWVDKPKNKSQRANNRLRYLLGRVALEVDRSNSIKNLAEQTGYSHAVVHQYISIGKFSAECATVFEDTFGRALCPNEWLRDPLSIPTSTGRTSKK